MRTLTFRILLAFLLLLTYLCSGAAYSAETRIRAGGAYTDALGRQWLSDTAFVTGGQLYADSGPIANTGDAALYLTHRYGSLTYRIPTSGRVRVTLHFAEIYFTQAGQRVFVSTVEGVPATLDVVALAGARAAYQYTVDTDVTDGELSVVLSPGGANNPMISAVEVIEVIEPTPPPVFKLPAPACDPREAYEFKVRLGNPGGLVWWCDRPFGMVRNHRTWSDQKKGATTPNTDDWREADRAVFTRPSTLKEHGVVSELSRRFEPKCYARTSGTATSVPVYGATSSWTRGPQRRDSKGLPMTIASGAQIGCDARLLVSTRYCLAQGRKSTTGEAIPLNSFALCNVVKSPTEGWEAP